MLALFLKRGKDDICRPAEHGAQRHSLVNALNKSKPAVLTYLDNKSCAVSLIEALPQNNTAYFSLESLKNTSIRSNAPPRHTSREQTWRLGAAAAVESGRCPRATPGGATQAANSNPQQGELCETGNPDNSSCDDLLTVGPIESLEKNTLWCLRKFFCNVKRHN